MVEPQEICFVSSHYPIETFFAQQTRKSFEKYTSKHGYNFFYDEDLPESEEVYVLHYQRCSSIQKASVKYPDTKWFVWVDSDVYVNKYDLPVETQIDLTDSNILYHLFHEQNWGIYPINTGVKFVNKKALGYEKSIWENKHNSPWNQFPFEQKAVYEHVLPQIPSQYIIHDPYVLNCIVKAYPDKLNDALFIHMCYSSVEERNDIVTSKNILCE